MDQKALLVSGGVFAVVFAGVLFLPFDRMFKPSAPDAAKEPLQARVDPVFHTVPPDNRPEAVKSAERIDGEVSNVAMYAKMNGLDSKPEAEVRAAVDDAPTAPGYVAYGSVANISIPMDVTDDIDTSGLKVACFSIRNPVSRADAHALPSSSIHQMILYDATRYIPAETVELYAWVYSGCAAAVRSGSAINATRYEMTLHDLMPHTPQYDAQRQKIMQNLNSGPTKR